MDDVALRTGGRTYSGWKGLRVKRSMGSCADGFTLTVSELWPDMSAPAKIHPGDACELLVNGKRLLTGYVDAVEMSIDARSRSVEVSGRARTADLVDCSAVRAGGQWRGATVEAIARDLAAPFGVAVRADVATGKALPSFALQQGETAFDAIDRAARIRALLVVADANGDLVLTRAGTARTSTVLALGRNLLAATATLDVRDRYSEYVFKGQAAGGDWFSGKAAAQMVHRVRDPQVQRYRPLVVVNDAPDAGGSLKQRAQWEANVRAARSTEVQVRVQGWHAAEGLWQPNTRVRVVAEPLRLDDELLLTAAEFMLDEHGQTCTLELTRADAFSLLPSAAVAAAPATWWTLPRAPAPADRHAATAGGR